MTLDGAWLKTAVSRTADREPTGLHGTAELFQGKSPQITLRVEDGRILGEAHGGTDSQFPFTNVQAEELVEGRLKCAVEYMRGDLKATGSTAAILAVIDALDSLHD